jgi:hypothetical protein
MVGKIENSLVFAFFNELVERRENALARGHAHRCMLKLAQKGAKFFERKSFLGDGGCQRFHDFLDLFRRELHGAEDAVENPPEDFLSYGPYAIAG